MSVVHLGPEDVVTTAPDAQESDAVEKLGSENVSVIVATDDDPAGIITDRDIALNVTADDNVGTESVQSIMTEDPATLTEDEKAMEIARTIKRTTFGGFQSLTMQEN